MNRIGLYISDVLDAKKRHNDDGEISSQIFTIINRTQESEILTIFQRLFESLVENGKIDREWGEAVQQLLTYHADTMDEATSLRDASKGRSFPHNVAFASR